MSIDVIFLGLDGVLFDTETAHLAACNAAFAGAGLSLCWDARALRHAVATHGYARAIDGALPPTMPARDRKRAADMVADKHREFHHAIVTAPPKALPAALALIDAAIADGCKICILTDLPAATASALLSNAFGTDVNSRFTVVTGGASFDAPAATGPYARALHAIGVQASDAIAIDAGAPALLAAESAGLWTVTIAPARHGADVVRPRQFITYDALRELHASPYSHLAPSPSPAPAAAPRKLAA
ncbi:beta-phosphoglucomutase-like phosphatase (HAD superfamily) [Duganella sp. 3397]|uniref:HAD family hydrolase n=1 Tax=Duganella sp. 3397 TaxID=2817732 RepID=UPI00285C98B0|nr:HAD family hydrolase [Duganella sp. 3397]MDR7050739.1 beta-phosphoglucomutase-like phosphatase (HAD superfamily) [Duganella sp. 3397]